MKKTFIWANFFLVFGYVFGLGLFAWGIYRCITSPPASIAKFFGGDIDDAIITFSLFGSFFLIIGGIFVVLLYKLFIVKSALKFSSELKSSIKVVSKVLGYTFQIMARTGRKVTMSNVFLLFANFRMESERISRSKISIFTIRFLKMTSES